MADDDFHIGALDPSDDRAFQHLVEIYEEAIPREERKSPAVLREMTRRDDYRVLAGSHGGALVCFAVVLGFSGTDACLLEYMAVDRTKRGAGWGGRLFRHMADLDMVRNRTLIMEVDSDKDGADKKAEAGRRKRFYQALGCKEVEGLSYIMPKVSSGRPPPMELLVYQSMLEPGLGPTIAKNLLHGWLSCIYAEVYQQSAEDPRIRRMLNPLPKSLRLI